MPLARSSLGARRVALILAAAVAAIAVGVVGFSVGRLSTLDDPAPTSTSAEAGFARDMQVHHLQGVELAMIIRDRTDDEAVRLLGYDIATTQAQQAGQLYGWLTEWDLSQAGPEPSMTWMTRPGRTDDAHTHTDGAHTPGEPMPGLATDAQIAALTAATGVAAERQFLTLMIAHHLGAVEMAEAVQDRAVNTSVLGFANSVIISQEAEITLMEDMLAAR
ncbi:DUF305 domain-containing protein [Cryobacterium sp.]|jgi:uncharacterized protein (DUF305 family)|uniref:DUF305 domain-containing protein n=1 Tax=Cryobacterium sp. TaxID=1926290 RepID=UPI00262FC540|nr:DUF305 domain-containing protein [Cryobacterium sp.]MCU1445981.1 hypothetical protein [Cryobacterium sp.]